MLESDDAVVVDSGVGLRCRSKCRSWLKLLEMVDAVIIEDGVDKSGVGDAVELIYSTIMKN
jgi:hypothetical protein